ncbi:conserved hypothetical protein [Desulfonatronospira thiodismutans ASO3-1]|uniref:Uncharacterized protein n=1 Tax=Desulfonatronospira thiodismutans ASO3-1 TaxID=555779 RepID=D6SRT0_9BACT|nr:MULTISPECIES: hypothetical protein [Desulfonatronospira]EFI33396.1 conserved hypothetical protein [Desulfonatronospira thiodismutans ASO3-1]RQD76895.1 MAG: hypothetical protein D5S03_05425 [Desulfonatronospira sp. MSAO_Bac3]
MSTEPFTQEQISFLKEHMSQWLAEQSLGKPPMVYEIELRERMVRVEEELRNQRELIQYIIEQMDKRFEQVDKRFQQVDKRFEQVDKRFEEMRQDMNARFEQVDRRFEEMRQDMNSRFEQVDKRFEQADQRFLALTKRMDRLLIWSFGTTVTVGALIVAILKLT